MSPDEQLRHVSAMLHHLYEIQRHSPGAAALDALNAIIALRSAIYDRAKDEGPEVAPPEPFDPRDLSKDRPRGEGS